MSTNSPYILGNVIRDPHLFFGRSDELAQLITALTKGQSRAVVGLRRIGKSSLLYQLAHHTPLPDHIAIAYIDLLSASHHTQAGLLTGILEGLNRVLGQRYVLPPEVGMVAFAQMIRRMKDDGYQPVVCLDELERLMTHPTIFDRAFFEAWRAIGSMSELAFVTASRVAIQDVVQHQGQTSPFANIFIQMTLAGLDEAAWQALLTQPFQRAGRPAPVPAHLDYVRTLTGRHPFFAQIAGEILWTTDSVNRETFRQQFTSRAKEPLTRLWQDLSPVEQAAARRLATGQGAVPQWAERQQELLATGLAELKATGAGEADPEPQLFTQLLTDWLKTGVLTQSASARPVPVPESEPAPALKPTINPATPPIYASALVFLAGLGVIGVLAQSLGWGVWLVLPLVAVYLAFVLVGDGKITGQDFLAAVDKWLRGFWPKG